MALLYRSGSRELGTWMMMGWIDSGLVSGSLKVTFCATVHGSRMLAGLQKKPGKDNPPSDPCQCGDEVPHPRRHGCKNPSAVFGFRLSPTCHSETRTESVCTLSPGCPAFSAIPSFIPPEAASDGVYC